MNTPLRETRTGSFTIQAPTYDDWDAVYAMFSKAINIDGDPVSSAAELALFEPERSLIALRDGEIVGTLGATTRRIAVPGAVVTAAHGCRGAVSSTARRRGLLTLLMRRHFEDSRAAGEGIALCWASEGRIYHRFGYGLAVWRVGMNIEQREVAPPRGEPEGRIVEGNPAELRDVLVKLYDQHYAARPGWSERGPRHWDYRLAGLPRWRGDEPGLRVALYEGPEGIDGYALFRVAGGWDNYGPTGEVGVLEHVAATPQAYAAIWKFLLTIDLTRTTQVWSCATDEPLLSWVEEPRQLHATVNDGLFVRVVNVARALSDRRYATPVDLAIEVTDGFLPDNAGRFRLTGSLESAECVPTTGEPDLVLDVRALGAAYFGGTSLTSMEGAGLVRELRPGAVAAATNAFRWHQAPSAFEIY